MSAAKQKHITVTLTRAEAVNLLYATSNTLGHPDAEKAAFSYKSHRDAAYRAHDKIQAALDPMQLPNKP